MSAQLNHSGSLPVCRLGFQVQAQLHAPDDLVVLSWQPVYFFWLQVVVATVAFGMGVDKGEGCSLVALARCFCCYWQGGLDNACQQLMYKQLQARSSIGYCCACGYAQ